MTADEALAWLRDRGEVRRSIRSLARTWRWPKSTVWWTLQRWEEQGLITVSGSKETGTLIRWCVAESPKQPGIRIDLTATRHGDQVRVQGRIGDTHVSLAGPKRPTLTSLDEIICASLRRALEGGDG